MPGSRRWVIFTIAALFIAVAVLGAHAASTDDITTEVRINARELADGRVEFSLQQRDGDDWGDRQLVEGRYLPRNPQRNAWYQSSAFAVTFPTSTLLAGTEMVMEGGVSRSTTTVTGQTPAVQQPATSVPVGAQEITNSSGGRMHVSCGSQDHQWRVDFYAIASTTPFHARHVLAAGAQVPVRASGKTYYFVVPDHGGHGDVEQAAYANHPGTKASLTGADARSFWQAAQQAGRVSIRLPILPPAGRIQEPSHSFSLSGVQICTAPAQQTSTPEPRSGVTGQAPKATVTQPTSGAGTFTGLAIASTAIYTAEMRVTCGPSTGAWRVAIRIHEQGDYHRLDSGTVRTTVGGQSFSFRVSSTSATLAGATARNFYQAARSALSHSMSLSSEKGNNELVFTFAEPICG